MNIDICSVLIFGCSESLAKERFILTILQEEGQCE